MRSHLATRFIYLNVVVHCCACTKLTSPALDVSAVSCRSDSDIKFRIVTLKKFTKALEAEILRIFMKTRQTRQTRT